MRNYWLTEQPLSDGKRRLHLETCRELPGLREVRPVGLHEGPADALKLARMLEPDTVACAFCLPGCETENG